MPALRHVALRRLLLQDLDGEPLPLERGDVIPAELEGRWIDRAVSTGRIAVEVLPSGDGGGHGSPPAVAAASLPDAELVEELRSRGFRVHRPKKQ